MNFFEKEMREMFGQCELLRDSKFCGKMMNQIFGCDRI